MARASAVLGKLLRVVAFLVLSLAIVALGAYLLRGPLLGRLLAERIERELAARLGGRFSVERVEGSYVFDLALVGLRTVEPPPGALRRLDCGRAVVEFDLRRMLEGDLGAITLVLASNAVVEVDLTRSGGGPGAAGEALPKRLPRLELYGRVSVVTPEGEVRAEGLSINTIGRERLGVRATELILPERFGPGRPFAGVVARTGPAAFTLESETPVAGVTPVHVAYDGAVHAALRIGGASAFLDVADGKARLISDGLDLARLPGWARDLLPEGIPPPHEALATLEINVASFRPLAFDAFAGSSRVLWRDLDLRDVRVDVRHEDGRTLVRTAHAEGEGFLLDAKDVVVDPALPSVVGDVGEATVRVADLRTLEPRLDRPLSFSVKARRASAGGFTVDEVRIEGDGILLEGRGEVVPPDDPARWRESRVSVAYTGSVRDLAAGSYGFAGTVRLSGDVTGTLGAPEAAIAVEGGDLTVEGTRVDSARLKGRLSPHLLHIEEVRVEAAGGTFRAEGAVDLDKRTLVGGGYEFDVPDLEGFLSVFPGAPPVRGSLSGNGRIASEETGLYGWCFLSGHDIVLAGRSVGEVRVTAGVGGNGGLIPEAEVRGPWGAAYGHGRIDWDEASASVGALRIDAGRFQAMANRPFRIWWEEGGARTGALDFSALGGSVLGMATLKGDRIEASLRGEGIDLAAIDPRLEGRAVISLRVDGDTYEIDLTAPEARLAAEDLPPAEVRLKALSGLDGIRVDRLSLKAGDVFSVDGTAMLPWRFDGERLQRIESVAPVLALNVRVGEVGRRGVSAGGAVVTVRGEGRELKANARIRDVSVHGFSPRGETWLDVDVSPGRVTGWAVLERSDLGEAEARITADRGFDWTEPRGIRAALDAARLDGVVQVRVPDLAALRRFLEGIAELRGEADGTVVVRGRAAAPELQGTFHLAGVEGRAEGATPRFAGGRGELSFDGRILRVESFTGELGYAPVGASGTIDLLAAEGPDLDLRLSGTNALLVNDPTLRVRADLDVVVRGPPDALRLAGKARITDALYTRPINLLSRGERAASGELAFFHARRGALATASLDLDVAADRTIRIRTPTVRGELSCDLKIRGTGAAPAPEGRVFFRDLLVEIQSVMGLKVDRGEIVFLAGEPFDPRLDVAAHTRLKGYDLDVLLLGRVADLDLQVATRPALPQDEAILLLVTGYTREELEREGIERAALEKLAVFLGERLVSRLGGPRDPDERTFLERFHFVVGKDVSRSGESTIEAEFEASDHLFLRVERDRFDDYNGGVVWRIRFR